MLGLLDSDVEIRLEKQAQKSSGHSSHSMLCNLFDTGALHLAHKFDILRVAATS